MRIRLANRARLLVTASALGALLATGAHASTITIVNGDGPGEGLNDPTVVAPVGGNPGTTRGAQRLNVLQAAANVWGGLLISTVPMTVLARFDPLGCGLSGVLGNGGTTTLHVDFPGAPHAGTLYPQALANKFAGSDLDPGNDDMRLTFNSDIGGPGCTLTFYLGLDANPPGAAFDLMTVALHELGHGLGFAAEYNPTTGAKNSGFDDIFMLGLEDHSTTKLFPAMTNAERLTAQVDNGDLHWTGAATVASSGILTAGRHPSGHVQMFAPASYQPGSSVSHFDTACAPDQLLEPVYTAALHDVGLTRDVLIDLGWSGCGDGVIDPGEQCDDGNTLDGDCCSSSCQYEADLGPCDDGDACTAGDHCNATGSCIATPIGDGGACSDGDACTFGETCTGGICGGGSPYACPLCEQCDGTGTCAAVPQTVPACHLPLLANKAQVQIKDKTPDTGDGVQFKWVKGKATTLGDLGDPLTTDEYALCIYTGAVPTLTFRALMPAGGICATKPCWKAAGTTGFKYKDKDATPDGATNLVLKSGIDGKAKAVFKAKGVNLTGRPFGMPSPPLASLPVRVQLQSDTGQCWEAHFSTFIKNEAGAFKAKAD